MTIKVSLKIILYKSLTRHLIKSPRYLSFLFKFIINTLYSPSHFQGTDKYTIPLILICDQGASIIIPLNYKNMRFKEVTDLSKSYSYVHSTIFASPSTADPCNWGRTPSGTPSRHRCYFSPFGLLMTLSLCKTDCVLQLSGVPGKLF